MARSDPLFGASGFFFGDVRLVEGVWSVPHRDQLGSVQVITASTYTRALRRQYRPFGEVGGVGPMCADCPPYGVAARSGDCGHPGKGA